MGTNSLFFDDIRFAKEIELDEFRRRSWVERIAEKAASRVTRIL